MTSRTACTTSRHARDLSIVVACRRRDPVTAALDTKKRWMSMCALCPDPDERPYTSIEREVVIRGIYFGKS